MQINITEWLEQAAAAHPGTLRRGGLRLRQALVALAVLLVRWSRTGHKWPGTASLCLRSWGPLWSLAASGRLPARR